MARAPIDACLAPLSIGEVLRWSVAALLMGAAGIHFAMMGEHAGVSWTHGVFFGVAAWLRVALAVAVIRRRPSRVVIGAVVLVNIALLDVWILTRTVGIAIGGDGTPEAWGTIDGVCAALEGLAILASIGLLAPRFVRRPISAVAGMAGAAFVAIVVAALVTFVFSPAAVGGNGNGTSADGHNHGATPVSADGHNHGVAAPVGHTHGVATLNGAPVKGVKAADVAAESQPDKPLDAATRRAQDTTHAGARGRTHVSDRRAGHCRRLRPRGWLRTRQRRPLHQGLLHDRCRAVPAGAADVADLRRDLRRPRRSPG